MHTYVHVHIYIYIYTCIIDIQNGCSAVRIQATAASFWSSIASTWTSVATCAVTAPSTGISCGSAAGSSSQVPERQYKKWSWLMNKRYNRLTQIHHWSQIRSYFPQYEVSWSFHFFCCRSCSPTARPGALSSTAGASSGFVAWRETQEIWSLPKPKPQVWQLFGLNKFSHSLGWYPGLRWQVGATLCVLPTSKLEIKTKDMFSSTTNSGLILTLLRDGSWSPCGRPCQHFWWSNLVL